MWAAHTPPTTASSDSGEFAPVLWKQITIDHNSTIGCFSILDQTVTIFFCQHTDQVTVSDMQKCLTVLLLNAQIETEKQLSQCYCILTQVLDTFPPYLLNHNWNLAGNVMCCISLYHEWGLLLQMHFSLEYIVLYYIFIWTPREELVTTP